MRAQWLQPERAQVRVFSEEVRVSGRALPVSELREAPVLPLLPLPEEQVLRLPLQRVLRVSELPQEQRFSELREEPVSAGAEQMFSELRALRVSEVLLVLREPDLPAGSCEP